MSEHRLSEGLEPEQVEALGDLRGLAEQLSRYEAPAPDTAALLARLAARPASAAGDGWRGWWRLAQMQSTLLNTRFWLASMLIVVLGALLINLYGGQMMVVYGLCSPVLAVVGTAYLFRPETRTLYEFELFGGYSPLEMLYVRLLLVLAYTSGITFIMLLAASMHGVNIVLWRLLIVWFGPMVGMTGLSLYATVRWNGYVGAALPMCIWAVLLFLGWQETRPSLVLDAGVIETLASAVSHSNGLLLAALAGLAGGLTMIWRAGAWVTRDDPAAAGF